MYNSKKGHIKNKSHVFERITLENMRRMLVTSLAFVVLFFVESVSMYLGRNPSTPVMLYYVPMVAVPVIYVTFAAIMFYRLSCRNTESVGLVRGFWAFSAVACFMAVFLLDDQFSIIMKMMVTAAILALVPLLDKQEYIVLAILEAIAGLVLLLVNAIDGEHFVYLICGYVMCGVISRQAYYAYLRKVEDATKLNSAKNQAETDPMTTMLNRRGLERRIAHVWPHCVRQGVEVAVIMMDIDNFKKYNDHFGHSAGDECIRAVAKAIKTQTKRKTDYCARVGGEEFLIFLSGISAQDAVVWAQNCKKAVEDQVIPHSPENFLPYVTMSMGIAHVQVNGTTEFWELRNEADRSLYQAKEEGRACIFMKDKCYAKTTPELSKKQYFMERGFRSIG